MRTFAQKPKTSQQSSTAKSPKPRRPFFGQSHEADVFFQLQPTIGNQAVPKLLRSNAEERNTLLTGTTSPRLGPVLSRIPVTAPRAGVIQTKPAINRPGDEYEQEADRIAEQVMRMPEPKLQHACACGRACPKCKAEQLSEEMDRFQTKRLRASDTEQDSVPPIVHEVLQSPGQPLDSATRAYMEPRFDHDFGKVQVHTDNKAAKSAQAMNALAYTAKQHVVFGASQFSPEAGSGLRLLAHELTHVIQQNGGVHKKINQLQPGQAVGTMGATTRGPGGSSGRVSEGMGVHLHFSVQRVISEPPPRGLSGDDERIPGVRIRPDSWLSELEVNLAMGVPVEDRSPSARREAARRRAAAASAAAERAPAETAPTEPAPTEPTERGEVQRKAVNTFLERTTLSRTATDIIQRTPRDEHDPVTRLERGMTLPYREATELAECEELMGEGGRDYCYQHILGIRAPAIRPGATLLPPYGLNVSVPGVVQFTTSMGNFYRFPARAHRANRRNRPQFQHPASVMVVYSGAGSHGSARVHPAVVSALDTMMSAMHAEGGRLNDESLKQARVQSAFRAPTVAEGSRYLSALRRTITRNPSIFGSRTFSTSLEATARSELGFTGSPAHRAFEAAIAAEPGWNAALARRLIRITAGFKAPRGGSTHHSGVVVDINFPYAVSNLSFNWHGLDRGNNADAFRSAAGVWLYTYAPLFEFDSYDTSKEIFHQEWRNWAGTSADPAASSSTGP